MKSLNSGSDRIYYSFPSLSQDKMRYCLEWIFISDLVIECELATNLFRWTLADRCIRRGRFLPLDELREGQCFNSRRNWLDERPETSLICVSPSHAWISLFEGLWPFYSKADWRMWQIWSRDKKISYAGDVDKFCARNNPVTEEVEPESWFCEFV